MSTKTVRRLEMLSRLFIEGMERNLFKIDLKNGFHHQDIFEPHQKFLGFSWVFKGNKVFNFHSFTIWLNSTPFIFSTVARSLVKYWRFNSTKIRCFLDDGIGIEYNYEESKRKFEFVQETLKKKSGFILNIQKSTWERCKILTWVGILKGIFHQEHWKSPSLALIAIWIQFSYSAEDICFSQNFGKACWTTYFNKIRKRRYCKTQNTISLLIYRNYSDTVDEILFWKFKVVKYNNKVINCYNTPWFQVHSDASNTGITCVFDLRGKNICYRNLTDLEKTFISILRELEAIQLSLLSLISLEINAFWYIDNLST